MKTLLITLRKASYIVLLLSHLCKLLCVILESIFMRARACVCACACACVCVHACMHKQLGIHPEQHLILMTPANACTSTYPASASVSCNTTFVVKNLAIGKELAINDQFS